MKKIVPLAIVAAFAFFFVSACSKKGAVRTSEFEQAFSVSKKTPAPSEAQVQMVSFTNRSVAAGVASVSAEAMEAIRKEDLPRAIEALTVLRSQPNLTPEQWIAVQNLMGNVQSTLAQRAANGDAAAKRSMDEYRAAKRAMRR